MDIAALRAMFKDKWAKLGIKLVKLGLKWAKLAQLTPFMPISAQSLENEPQIGPYEAKAESQVDLLEAKVDKYDLSMG